MTAWLDIVKKHSKMNKGKSLKEFLPDAKKEYDMLKKSGKIQFKSTSSKKTKSFKKRGKSKKYTRKQRGRGGLMGGNDPDAAADNSYGVGNLFGDGDGAAADGDDDDDYDNGNGTSDGAAAADGDGVGVVGRTMEGGKGRKGVKRSRKGVKRSRKGGKTSKKGRKGRKKSKRSRK